jgi:NitT/TauT family transport system permease protein
VLPSFAWWIDGSLILVVIAAAAGVVVAASRWAAPLTPNAQIDLSLSALPLYAGLSTLRMALAYLLSLAFSLVYARVAFASRPAERVMLPLLDILQSIPILSFLPGVVLGLVALFPHSNVGLELSAIILIFTSQAWNMAFSFHQSLLTIPKSLREVATIHRLNFWQRFTRLEVPFGMIALIWNSMMSWAGGWFFLIAAEQFTLGSHSFQLPGLGSYLQTAANAGDVGALALGLVTLIIVIVLLDQLLWRPLLAWADRFKIEQTASGQAPTSAVLLALRRSALLAGARRHIFAPAGVWLDRLMNRLLPAPEAVLTAQPDQSTRRRLRLRRVAGVVLLTALAAGTLWGIVAAGTLLFHLSADDWASISLSAGATLLRTTAALVIGVAWTVPLGVAIGLNPRLAKRAQPLVQMAASIPALALFPALLLVLIGLPGGLNIAAVALMLLGTQWYILFNVIAGAMAIPSDLREAATIYKLRGWRRWRTLILPAIFPYLVTGMLTATGGAWNASIVSEYVTFNNHTYSTIGLGALIASSANAGNFALLLASTLAMSAVVVTVNRLFWRRLYVVAEQRFRLE